MWEDEQDVSRSRCMSGKSYINKSPMIPPSNHEVIQNLAQRLHHSDCKETTRFLNFTKKIDNPVRVISPNPQRAAQPKTKFNISGMLQQIQESVPPPVVNKSKNSAFKPINTSNLDVQP